jgi:ABC-type sulfate transport system permease component
VSYSSDYDARKSRRRIAGCGFVLLALLSFLVLALALFMSGLLFGDCTIAQPDCHAASNRSFGMVMLAVLVVDAAAGSLLGWWQSRSRKS